MKPYLESPRIIDGIKEWLEKAEPKHKWMSINNSSWHMSVFPQFHTNIEEIHRNLRSEEEDPMCYSTTSVVWDIQENKAIYVWHEFNELPESTTEDVESYDEEIRRIQASREEKKRAQRKQKKEEAERLNQIDSRRKRLEKDYQEYIWKCIEDESEPLSFYEYNRVDQ